MPLPTERRLRRGNAAEGCLFNAQYGDTWPIRPLHHSSSIWGEGVCGFKAVQTMRDARLVARLDDYARKTVREAALWAWLWRPGGACESDT